MNKLMRTGVFVLAGLVVGVLVGAYFGATYIAKPAREMSALITTAWAGERANMQYENAGYAEAREALEHYIEVLQSVAAHPELNLTRIAHSDMGLAYTRLALLAEANGSPAESPKLMARAVEEARAGGFKDPSAEHLRALVQQLGRPRSPTPKPGA